MVFSSITFLTAFLPVVFILHTLIPAIQVRNVLLLMASLLFYAYGEPVYILLLLFSALFNYAAARLIGSCMHRGESAGGRGWLILAAAVNIGLLVLFKYAGFLLGTVRSLTGLPLPVPGLRLPVGISFYTFQALSYVIDVYRGKVRPERNFPKVLLYISFFPQLIAGPIVQYHDVEEELKERSAKAGDIHRGIRRFIRGLAKKVLVANTMAACADRLFALPAGTIGTGAAWIGAFSYMMQIYFDFSGYSDMAIGMGWMFGFHFKENFDLPYTAGSIKDFWRRWHISLSGWFREYVYIPLGGNRRGRPRTILNKWIVFLLTGIWHGANMTFLFWGFYHGFFLMLEEVAGRFRLSASGPARRVAGALRHLYTLLVVLVGFVFFRADTVTDGFKRMAAMFTGAPGDAASAVALTGCLTPLFLTGAAAALVWSGAVLPGTVFKALGRKKSGAASAAADVLSIAVLILCLLSLAGGTYNPFIYFRF